MFIERDRFAFFDLPFHVPEDDITVAPDQGRFQPVLLFLRLFIVLASALLISQATVAENLTGEENDIIDPINELYGKNITNGEYLEAASPGYLETLRGEMGRR